MPHGILVKLAFFHLEFFALPLAYLTSFALLLLSGDCPVRASTVGASTALQPALSLLLAAEPEKSAVPHTAGLLLRQRGQHEHPQGRDELETHRRLSARTGQRQKRAFGSAGSHEQQQLSTITIPHNIHTFRLVALCLFSILH